MGTWGLKNFENDSASDYRLDIIENGTSFVAKALLKIEKASNSDYLEAPDCEEALVAAEFIAAFKGNPSDEINEDEQNWLSSTNLDKVKLSLFKKVNSAELAKNVVNKIIQSSELQELWEETDEYQDWIQVQKDLIKRLG